MFLDHLVVVLRIGYLTVPCVSDIALQDVDLLVHRVLEDLAEAVQGIWWHGHGVQTSEMAEELYLRNRWEGRKQGSGRPSQDIGVNGADIKTKCIPGESQHRPTPGRNQGRIEAVS